MYIFLILILLFCLAIFITIITELYQKSELSVENKSFLKVTYIYLTLVIILIIIMIVIPEFLHSRMIDNRQLTLLGFALLTVTYTTRINQSINKIKRNILSILLFIYTYTLIPLMFLTVDDGVNSVIRTIENFYITFGLLQTLYILFKFIFTRIK